MNWSITKRPKSWDDIYGCDNFKKAVRAWTKKGDAPIGVMLSGVWGSGKTTSAKIYAATLACKNTKDGNPCGECSTCKSIFEERWDRDVIMIDGGRAGKEQLLDELTDFVSFPARKDKCKVVIIEEVQELHDKARNSMLKMLEMTYSGYHFVMLTMKEVAKGGFASRSQVFRFKPLDTEDLAKFLWRFCKNENIMIPIDEAQVPTILWTIAGASNGSIREAVQNLERVVDTEMWDPIEISKELGSLDEMSQIEILTALLDGKCDNILYAKLLQEHDFDKVLKFNMNAISAAAAKKQFGVDSGAAFVKGSGYDDMTENQKKSWEAAMQRKAFATKKSMELLVAHPNFEIVKDGFRDACKTLDTFSEDLKKANYVIMLSDIAERVKSNSVPEKPVEKLPVRRTVKAPPM
jgi:DNA polymerase III gamma/tau subunit